MSIIWKGEERMIPGYCLAETGKPLPDNIPKDVIDSFINQGLAERKTVKTSKLQEN